MSEFKHISEAVNTVVERAEMLRLLKCWLELAERMQREYPLHVDANMSVDFLQGCRETREFLADVEGP